MTIYRLVNSLYKHDLSGTGAKLYGARWNVAGFPMLYTSQFISLAVLESLVHLQKNNIPLSQHLLYIDIKNDFETVEITNKHLKKNWQHDINYTQWIGTEFIKNNKSLALKVPSAIIPEEYNILVNPLHADFKKTRIVSASLFEFDKRLIPQ